LKFYKKATALLLCGVLASSNFVFATDKIDAVRETIKNNYVVEVSEDILNRPTIDEIIEGLDDPHTHLFSPKEWKDFVGSIESSYAGIGVRIEKHQEGLEVLEIFAGYGADKAGFEIGDIITHVGEEQIKDMALETIISKIKGPVGTTVILKIKRGDETFERKVLRQEVHMTAVSHRLDKDGILYIKFSTFSQEAYEGFIEVLKKYQKSKLNGIIFDLRNNGGGYLNVAQSVIGAFVGSKPAVRIDNRDGKRLLMANGTDLVGDRPIVILINKGSASASELTSAALDDYDKGILMGQNSYGKGSVQSMYSFVETGEILKMTTEYFYSPDGVEINGVGIKPNVEVAEDLDPLKMAELLLSGTEENGIKIWLQGQVFYIDPQKRAEDEYWECYKAFYENYGYAFINPFKSEYGAFFGDQQYVLEKNILKENFVEVSLAENRKREFQSPVAELIDANTGEKQKIEAKTKEDLLIVEWPKDLEVGEYFIRVYSGLERDLQNDSHVLIHFEKVEE
jgi:carboxyl-terminal processing protease